MPNWEVLDCNFNLTSFFLCFNLLPYTILEHHLPQVTVIIVVYEANDWIWYPFDTPDVRLIFLYCSTAYVHFTGHLVMLMDAP